MEHIKTQDDIDFAVNEFLSASIINKEQAEALKISILEIVNHKELHQYFKNNQEIMNERDILSKNGKTLRPDRLVINKKEATIIDYKTGLHNPKYQHQLQNYQDVIEDMGFNVINKILVYINNDIKIIQY